MTNDPSRRNQLDEYERMVLSGADRQAFLDALTNPPEPPERLIAVLRRHLELIS